MKVLILYKEEKGLIPKNYKEKEVICLSDSTLEKLFKDVPKDEELHYYKFAVTNFLDIDDYDIKTVKEYGTDRSWNLSSKGITCICPNYDSNEGIDFKSIVEPVTFDPYLASLLKMGYSNIKAHFAVIVKEEY